MKLRLILLAGTVVLACAGPAGAAPLSPAPGKPTPTGRGPVGVTVGYFDNDRVADLAVTNSSEGTVSILLGKGDGTFSPAGAPVQTGPDPQRSAVGDFNRDGHADLAVSDRDSSDVAVLLGDGAGHFTLSSRLTTNIPDDFTYGDPNTVLVGDFNTDGTADIAVTTVGPGGRGEVETFAGQGNGSFALARKVSLAEEGSGSGSVARLADLNGDGRYDIVTVNSYADQKRVQTLLGDGAGGFADGPSAAVGSGADGLVIGDFNKDGHQDAAVANHDDGTVTILLGNGQGTLVPTATVAAGKTPYDLVGGDFNGDGRYDLATPNADDNTVTLLLGDGKGGFTPVGQGPVGSRPTVVAAGRFDADGVDDLATGIFNDAVVRVLTSTASRAVTVRRHGKGGLAGRVLSTSPGCTAKQSVSLRRSGKAVGRQRTDAHGRFAFKRLRRGRYTAVVKATPGCRAAASKAISSR